MPFKNIARYGYQQTVSGAWDAGGGHRLTFLIEDARAERFTIEIFGPTNPQVPESSQTRGAVSRVRAEGTSATDISSKARPGLPVRGGEALLLNAIDVVGSFNAEAKSFACVRRSAFALGAPMTHGERNEGERKRETFREALSYRQAPGFDDLTWIADHYMALIDEGPYFVEQHGRRWWESGIIAIPQSVPVAGDPSVADPADMFMRVRTDLNGTELYLNLYTTLRYEITGFVPMILPRATADLDYDSDDVAIMGDWEP